MKGGNNSEVMMSRYSVVRVCNICIHHRHISTQSRCYADEDTGDIVVKFKRTILVRARANGEVELSDGGHHNVRHVTTSTTTLNAPSQSITLRRMNEALNHIGIRITDLNGTWTISDGKSLARFHDGVVWQPH